MDIAALLQQQASSINLELTKPFQGTKAGHLQKADNTDTKQLDKWSKEINEKTTTDIHDTAQISKEAIDKLNKDKYNNDNDKSKNEINYDDGNNVMKMAEHTKVDFARAKAVNAYRRFAS